jgi:MHS family proline/betaine transporter-like MFS transporter
VLAAIILLTAFATFCIGLLPPWSVIGLGTPSGGGEVSLAYLAEVSSPGNRGRTGASYLDPGVGVAALGVGVAALVLDAQGLMAWGWCPVLLVLSLSGVVGAYLRWRTAESPLYAPAQQRGPPGPDVAVSSFRRCFVLAAATVPCSSTSAVELAQCDGVWVISRVGSK